MARQLKAPGSDSDSVSSPNSSGRMSKSRSPKLIKRGSSSSIPTEKSRTGKISELESQLALLRDELKKVKEQLIATYTEKKQAQQEAEETKQQFTAVSTKLEESEKPLLELSASEDARVQELRRISHDHDREWQSELEAIHRQHSIDSNALASAMNEIQKLKKQLADSEMKKSRHAESAYAEIQSLWVEVSETLVLLKKMKHQLNDLKESEACALKIASEAEQQLKEIKAAAETFRSHGLKAKEAYDSLAVELRKSNAEVNSLEDINKQSTGPSGDGDNDHSKNQGEYKQSILDIGDAYDAVEHAKIKSALREAQLKGELRDAIEIRAQLKVQSDQWRKAAEASASMRSPEWNGKYVDRSVSLDSNYHTIGSKMGSPSWGRDGWSKEKRPYLMRQVKKGPWSSNWIHGFLFEIFGEILGEVELCSVIVQ